MVRFWRSTKDVRYMSRFVNALPALLVTALLVGCDDPSDCSSNAAMGYAMVFAEDTIKRRIPNPHVATFDLSAWEWSDYTNTWTIKGHVDTKNVFGGPLRYHYAVYLICRSEGDRRRWKLEAIDIGPN